MTKIINPSNTSNGLTKTFASVVIAPKENNRLKAQFSSQEEDRNFLIQQLVAVKKDNEKLRIEYSSMDLELKKVIEQNKSKDINNVNLPPNSRVNNVTVSNNNDKSGNSLIQKPNNAMLPISSTGPISSSKDSEERYKEVNIRLRRLLAEEKKALTNFRPDYLIDNLIEIKNIINNLNDN